MNFTAILCLAVAMAAAFVSADITVNPAKPDCQAKDTHCITIKAQDHNAEGLKKYSIAPLGKSDTGVCTKMYQDANRTRFAAAAMFSGTCSVQGPAVWKVDCTKDDANSSIVVHFYNDHTTFVAKGKGKANFTGAKKYLSGKHRKSGSPVVHVSCPK